MTLPRTMYVIRAGTPYRMFLVSVVLHQFWNCHKSDASEGFRTPGLPCSKTVLCQDQNPQDKYMDWSDFWREDTIQALHIGIGQEGT
jgi:hypothetical protein